MTVVRLDDDDSRTLVLGAAPTPQNRASHQHLARHLTDDLHGSRWVGEWQLWGGDSWTHLTRIGDRRAADAPDDPTT